MHDSSSKEKAAEIASRLIDVAHSVSDDVAALADEREEVYDIGDAAGLVAFVEAALRTSQLALDLAMPDGVVMTVCGDHVSTEV